MQTNDMIVALSGGRVGIDAGTERFYLIPDDIAMLLVFGKEVPLYQESGIIDAEASAFQHPHKKGIVISILEEVWLIPRETFIGLAHGTVPESIMEPMEWRGAA